MNILFITLNGIESKTFGGAKASYRNYMALKRLGTVEIYSIKKKSNFQSLISIFQLNYPPLSNYDKKIIRQKLKKNQYNLIFLDSSLLGSIIKHLQGIKTMVFYHNCEKDYNNVRFKSLSLKKIMYSYLAELNEKKITKEADFKICFSQRDSDRIKLLYGEKVDCIIPLSLEDQFNSYDENKTEKTCLLFGPVGTANIEGFDWFIKNVSPYLEGKTIVAGKGMDTQFKHAMSEKVEVIGFVKDINVLYNKALCVAIPLLSGAGMKIKTAEALMFGKRIFGTKEALEGYEICDENVFTECNNADEFIEKINIFMKTNSNKFNENSRNLFLKKYSLESSINLFDKAVNYVVDNKQ